MTQTIECLIHRKGGSVIELDADKYHFKPNAAGDHVCDVANEKHIATLLAIDTAYRPYIEQAADTDNGNEGRVDLTGAEITSDSGGENTDDSHTITDGSQNGEAEKKETIQEDEAAERERLAAIYTERFGKKPHHMMGVKRIREELGLDE